MGIFTSNKSAFRAAFEANNVPGLRALSGKKIDTYWIMFRNPAAYKEMPVETLRFFVEEASAGTWAAWWPYAKSAQTPEEKRGDVLNGIMYLTLEANRPDLLNLVLDHIKIKDLNEHEAGKHVIGTVIRSELADPDKCAVLRRLLAPGHGEIKDAATFLHDAASRNFIQGIDVLAAAGLDVHADDERLLRNAAKAGHANLCQHLIVAHNCDRDLAAATARKLGNTADAGWLETFAAGEGDGKPPTVESLSAEVRELKAAYRELAAQLQELRMPEKKLDKPLLPAQPGPKAAS